MTPRLMWSSQELQGIKEEGRRERRKEGGEGGREGGGEGGRDREKGRERKKRKEKWKEGKWPPQSDACQIKEVGTINSSQHS